MAQERNRELALRALELAKGRCAQAVLAGQMTAQEYEELTGESADGILQRVKDSVSSTFAKEATEAGDALVSAYNKARKNLVGAGVDEAEVYEILGQAEAMKLLSDEMLNIACAETGKDRETVLEGLAMAGMTAKVTVKKDDAAATAAEEAEEDAAEETEEV